MVGRWIAICLVFASLSLIVAGAARANHDTDCVLSGGTNGPAQLDCSLPDFVAQLGSTTPLTSKFAYTASTDQNPVTCALGTLTVLPPGVWLSIDTTVLDASSAPFRQEVMVTADPSGLAPGVYEASVAIALQIGAAPQCPSTPNGLNGVVSVRLRVAPATSAPTLTGVGILVVVLALGAVGLRRLRHSRV